MFKVALVHDWLTGMRGGERVLEHFLSLYPDADIFSLIHIPGSTSSRIDKRVVQTSFLNNIPSINRFYRHLLPLYPAAVRKFDFTGYDLVISLSHAAVKNIKVPSGVPHICYCFTPMRYAWDQRAHYFGKLTPVLEPILASLRAWDKRSSSGVTEFVGISSFIRTRLRAYYNRDSSVIHPPVNTSWITPIKEHWKGDAFLYAGALVPYKRADLVVEAFNQLKIPLRIVGSGSEEAKLKKRAGSNIEFLGKVSDVEFAELFRQSRALLFPGTEDFGMIPVECLASGRPIIGLYHGGLKDILNGLKCWKNSGELEGKPSGVFFPRSRTPVESVIEAVRYFMDREELFLPENCVRRAQLFSPEVFNRKWDSVVSRHLNCNTQIDQHAQTKTAAL